MHITDDDVVTLIHAKASNTAARDRQVSVSNYEVVVGQAIKNLRHLERITLADALQKGQRKQIAGAVWHDALRQRDRRGIIARAKAITGAYRRHLIVLQPQLTRAERDACASGRATAGRIMRMKQLDTLMLGAQLSAAAVGATFVGWASD